MTGVFLSTVTTMNINSHFLIASAVKTNGLTQIKVCGITQVQDALFAAQCGVDAVGMVFYPPSGRNLDSLQAKAIRDSLPPEVASVAVVVNPDDQLLDEIVQLVKPTYIQFHGEESVERCRESGIPFIKAIRVRHAEQISQAVDDYPDASGLLFDAYEKNKVGGTGRTFPWELMFRVDKPIILAGGLHRNNVAEAIQKVRPTAVDVSTGVEFSEGIKNQAAIQDFVCAVQAADRVHRPH